MSSDGDTHLEIGAALPAARQSTDPLATGSMNERVEHADRAVSAEVTPDSSASVSGEPPLIDAAELARLLLVSVKTIGRQLARKKLPPPFLLGRQRRWQRREIEERVAAGMPNQAAWDRHQRGNNRKQ